MGAVPSRDAFFDAGFAALSYLGYGHLELAEVCERVGVTTDSFSHYVADWTRSSIDPRVCAVHGQACAPFPQQTMTEPLPRGVGRPDTGVETRKH